MALDRRVVLLLTLAGAFLTCLVVGDIIGGKLTAITVGGHDFVISVGMIPFPVTFLLTEPFSFGAIPGGGERVTASTRGILRIGDVEREIDFELSGNVVGSRLVVAGSTLIVLADFDIEVPGSNVVLSVSDEATIELQLYLTRD